MLTEAALGVGLPGDRVAEVLAGADYADEVQADIAQAQAFGSSGVPFFVIDQKYGVSGAQPAELFSQALTKAWQEKHPKIQVLSADDGEACGPDGCAI